MQLPAKGTGQGDTSASTTREVAHEVNSKELLGNSDQLVIHHEQRRYVLRRTKSGKLILNA